MPVRLHAQPNTSLPDSRQNDAERMASRSLTFSPASRCLAPASKGRRECATRDYAESSESIDGSLTLHLVSSRRKFGKRIQRGGRRIDGSQRRDDATNRFHGSFHGHYRIAELPGLIGIGAGYEHYTRCQQGADSAEHLVFECPTVASEEDRADLIAAFAKLGARFPAMSTEAQLAAILHPATVPELDVPLYSFLGKLAAATRKETKATPRPEKLRRTKTDKKLRKAQKKARAHAAEAPADVTGSGRCTEEEKTEMQTASTP